MDTERFRAFVYPITFTGRVGSLCSLSQEAGSVDAAIDTTNEESLSLNLFLIVVKEERYLGRIDADSKITGEMLYAGDVTRTGLCYGALVHSPFSHARIRGIDTEAILALPGVLTVLTGADLKGRTFGRQVRDIPPLADKEVRYVGERVAVVVAETRELAEQAAAQVQVNYAPLENIVDFDRALDPGALHVHETPWAYPGAVVTQSDPPNLQSRIIMTHGEDIEKAWAHSAIKVDAVYTTPASHHGYLEPQASIAERGPDGRLHFWVCTKAPYRLRQSLATYFGRDEADIVLHPVAVGGDFGGKGAPVDAVLCGELAQRVARPVRIVLRYNEDLVTTETRHASKIRIRLGCDPQGQLTVLDMDALFNGGAYAGYKPVPTAELVGVRHAAAGYRIPSMRVLSSIVYTHLIPAGHMRAPGSPQITFAIESALDELARQGGWDPFAFRAQNLLNPEDPDAWGHKPIELRVRPTFDAAWESIKPPGTVPIPQGWRYGRGVAIADHPTSAGQLSMRLVPTTGGVTCQVPFPETGTGSHTVVQRLLAQALNRDPTTIAVQQVSTTELPFDQGIGGSRLTGGISLAIRELVEAYQARGQQEAVTVSWSPSEMPYVTSFCVQIAEVAVDPETGQVRVLRLTSAVDVAEIVNPIAHQMQIEGGMAMGYGFAVMEDLVLSEGQVTAANLGEFKIPSPRDVPPFCVILVAGGQGLGAGNVKAIGELSNCPTGGAIANAVADAIGVRLRSLPITAENVWRALKEGGREHAPDISA